ncbi:inositol monophosphatase family protein [Rugamonas sp. CCM 8940]|uniref:inositol monophosphatase family protein n=1 Tax=Rugamonas sp. CCM 8940 TaxID=2765359 RepID=UPI0018F70C35|nr:inositol monophosphatase [Rugamonas sp. CCM 8940]MBJ7311210.1 inositol monophosphatase [Rugamonas sp. CCM 8940]
MVEYDMKTVAVELVRQAGALLRQQFGAGHQVRSKGDVSNIVTEADLASERLLVEGLRRHFPGHSIIAEESGCDLLPSDYTWVVDPLDGSSNFAAGLPWFGVLLALLHGGEPVLGLLYLPMSDELYEAEKGHGARRNGEPVRVSSCAELGGVLWNVGMDSSPDEGRRRVCAESLVRLLQSVRNVRATNCLLDAAFTADGRIGGVLNHSERLWDIAAPMLIVQEAGGRFTDPQGRPLRLDLSASAAERDYAVLAGAPALHAAVVELLR